MLAKGAPYIWLGQSLLSFDFSKALVEPTNAKIDATPATNLAITEFVCTGTVMNQVLSIDAELPEMMAPAETC